MTRRSLVTTLTTGLHCRTLFRCDHMCTVYILHTTSSYHGRFLELDFLSGTWPRDVIEWYAIGLFNV